MKIGRILAVIFVGLALSFAVDAKPQRMENVKRQADREALKSIKADVLYTIDPANVNSISSLAEAKAYLLVQQRVIKKLIRMTYESQQ